MIVALHAIAPSVAHAQRVEWIQKQRNVSEFISVDVLPGISTTILQFKPNTEIPGNMDHLKILRLCAELPEGLVVFCDPSITLTKFLQSTGQKFMLIRSNGELVK